MLETLEHAIEKLHQSLRAYIESAYHISDLHLVTKRRHLLDEPGVIRRLPYIESTPEYVTGERFEDLGLPDAATELLSALSTARGGEARLLHNPPFSHQAKALSEVLLNGRSIVVATGTGSGKTECFLLPILARLAEEAATSPVSFGQSSAMRSLLLYPMNALVNDQLSRLRRLFGAPRTAGFFVEHSGRPARFARYTSRTPYAGVRTPGKDSDRLKEIGDSFVALERLSDARTEEGIESLRLRSELESRGKWPAKPDLSSWFGPSGARWKKAGSDEFQRCVTLPGDAELLTRHEVQVAPADLLVTNYSMLEYMMMRPIERPIFDLTRDWLAAHSERSFILVIDEAHLYRGAAGAEVALLVRRLRHRLGIPASRLQVILTSASFGNPENAQAFAAQLTGKREEDFAVLEGDLKLWEGEEAGTIEQANRLASVDLDALYSAQNEEEEWAAVAPVLEGQSTEAGGSLRHQLYCFLRELPPMATARNLTMQQAVAVDELGSALFPDADRLIADRAATALLALGNLAKLDSGEVPLLPCRIHSFHRGLPGLWICMDSNCSALPEDSRGGPTGKLFSQPREKCECGARVYELYTCRICGATYARAYTDDVRNPQYLWHEAGVPYRSHEETVEELSPIDILLDEPVAAASVAEVAELDLSTGRVNPLQEGQRTRSIYIPRDRTPDASTPRCGSGQFRQCPVCGRTGAFGSSTIMDHQTKGDQPFFSIVSEQLKIQPPSSTIVSEFAPLRGRKVLVFSDSRQKAARLAPTIQRYTTRDALRPLVVAGMSTLLAHPDLNPFVSLDDLNLAVHCAARDLTVRLRPVLRSGESDELIASIEQQLQQGELSPFFLAESRASYCPQSLLLELISVLFDRNYGLEALALGTLCERRAHTEKLKSLPDLPGFTTGEDARVAWARTWLRFWARRTWLCQMPQDWWLEDVQGHKSGRFAGFQRLLSAEAWKVFHRDWLPGLLKTFTTTLSGTYRGLGKEMSLDFDVEWGYCEACRTTQRLVERMACVNCGSPTVRALDPEADAVFASRKQYYRQSTIEAFPPHCKPPMAIVAAEHTAQVGQIQSGQTLSIAEKNELLFQDVDVSALVEDESVYAVDVLSCTTTMEVGIDIGALAGVSLRNMPPARANYQQRSGRAGRRGNRIATVTAFGTGDTHDEHFFQNPEVMIRGAVKDPAIALDNVDIMKRHVLAFLLQRYHRERLPEFPSDDSPQLFEVLGTTADFMRTDTVLNYEDFKGWLGSNLELLKAEVCDWVPGQHASETARLIEGLREITLDLLDSALVQGEGPDKERGEQESILDETVPEPGADRSLGALAGRGQLLDTLLYKGVLPRYAFPTDVAGFHVFRPGSSTYRHEFEYTPQQSLVVALSQYAPGKDVWIDGKLWRSGALYSPYMEERANAWSARKLYYECSVCHFSEAKPSTEGTLGELLDCRACGSSQSVGPAKLWMRPPGFCHPIDIPPDIERDDPVAPTHATRAKLSAPAPTDQDAWRQVSAGIRTAHWRKHLMVTNTGPSKQGYTYCKRCGAIEPSVHGHASIEGPHPKPFPAKQSSCPGGSAVSGLVLGSDFISDILLISLLVEEPVSLDPRPVSTQVALRTVSESLVLAGSRILEIEPAELAAEFRPALTARGRDGTEAEIYLYDTLPGGAGFAHRLGELGEHLFAEALNILETCPENCDVSCYRCLRSYSNRGMSTEC